MGNQQYHIMTSPSAANLKRGAYCWFKRGTGKGIVTKWVDGNLTLESIRKAWRHYSQFGYYLRWFFVLYWNVERSRWEMWRWTRYRKWQSCSAVNILNR